MLKIKDNIDFIKLRKLGFKPKYDENTGEIIAYEKKNIDEEYVGLFVKIESIKSNIRIFKRKTRKIKRWIIDKNTEFFDIDTLYDLIKADLVEKVDG